MFILYPQRRAISVNTVLRVVKENGFTSYANDVEIVGTVILDKIKERGEEMNSIRRT